MALLGVGSIIGLLAGLIVVIFLVSIALYVYWALVWMTIARKLKYKNPWLAWIPVAQIFLIPILAKKHWTWGFMFLVPIANVVFLFIWTWNIFEQRKYPGWLALVPLLGFIPLVGLLASLAYLVILGLVAWSDR
ncbi:MAG: hypothetical protein KAJ30_07345 [Candidatus Heimdallarchaeota archaeon]|nr:hypothetical protein [Candidatus Heimdallarchaeota archaeon]